MVTIVSYVIMLSVILCDMYITVEVEPTKCITIDRMINTRTNYSFLKNELNSNNILCYL